MIAVMTFTALCDDALMRPRVTLLSASGQKGPQDWHKKWDPKTQCLTPVSMTLSHLFTVCLTLSDRAFDMSDEPMPAPDPRNSISLQLLRAVQLRTTYPYFTLSHQINKSQIIWSKISLIWPIVYTHCYKTSLQTVSTIYLKP